MQSYTLLLSLVAVIVGVGALRIRYPPRGCENCAPGERCVRAKIRCVAPPCPTHKCVVVKPGMCPPRQTRPGTCITKCETDGDCSGTRKCCGSCPRACVAPIPVSPCMHMKCSLGHRCLPRVVNCIRAPCPPIYSCVSTAPKPGVCPKIKPVGHRCTVDRQCSGHRKCCQGICVDPIKKDRCVAKCKPGHECLPKTVFCIRAPCPPAYSCISTAPKPGACPRFQPLGLRCKVDRQCYGNRKCCRGICAAPIRTDPCNGCQRGDVCMRMPVRCRRFPCRRGYRCVSTRPKPGVCPLLRRSSRYFRFCRSDSQCPRDMKCCRRRCVRPGRLNRCGGCKPGHACVPMNTICKRYPCLPSYQCVSTRPKPGSCPRVHYGHDFRVHHPCRYDSQCAGALKCCQGRCLSSDARPGRCPFHRFTVCKPFRKHDCTRDTDCPAPLKCCGPCRKTCTKPMPKPGLCPVSRRVCPHPVKPADQCNNDYDCKNSDKCCRDVCGNMACLNPGYNVIG